MMLMDCQPGDIVVIVEDDGERFAYLGALNGARRTRGKAKGSPSYAIVHDVDHDTLGVVPRSARTVEPTLEVVEVVEPVSFRRRMRLITSRADAMPSDDREVDPLASSRIEPEAF